MTDATATRTIGVSIPIPQPYGDHLQRARRRASDPLADAIPAHVTLCPPTEVADADLPAFTEHLRAVAAAHHPFSMILRGTGSFRPVSPVVFVAVAQGIVECEQLEAAVRSGPITRKLEFPYHPHVTIAQGVGEAELDGAFEELGHYTCRFPVPGFELYLHGDDQVWRPTERFAFGAAGVVGEPG